MHTDGQLNRKKERIDQTNKQTNKPIGTFKPDKPDSISQFSK